MPARHIQITPREKQESARMKDARSLGDEMAEREKELATKPKEES